MRNIDEILNFVKMASRQDNCWIPFVRGSRIPNFENRSIVFLSFFCLFHGECVEKVKTCGRRRLRRERFYLSGGVGSASANRNDASIEIWRERRSLPTYKQIWATHKKNAAAQLAVSPHRQLPS